MENTESDVKYGKHGVWRKKCGKHGVRRFASVKYGIIVIYANLNRQNIKIIRQ